MKRIVDRMQTSTPAFFRKLRNAGIAIGAIGATLLASPVALPAFLVKIAGYLVVAGTVAGSVSQTAVVDEKE